LKYPQISKGAAYGVVVLFLLTLALAGANLLFTAHAVNASQHQWCATLQLLTARPVSRPVDPKANPSRENTYVFYTNLLDLRRRFGCG
jgi:hypothetical protein